jgi:hypothetical protein
LHPPGSVANPSTGSLTPSWNLQKNRTLFVRKTVTVLKLWLILSQEKETMGMKDFQPGAADQALWDMTRSEFQYKEQYSIADGVNILNEGTFLAKYDGGAGEAVVAPCAGTADEIFAGVALHSGIEGYLWADVLAATVPNVAAPTIDVGHTNLINDGASPATCLCRVQYTATGVDFTINDAATPPGGAGVVQVNPATGIFTFNAADANVGVTITYRWMLSAVEKEIYLGQSNVNRGAEHYLGIMTVGCGRCRVYTMMYDARADWNVLSTVAGDQVVMAPNGEVSTATLVATGTLLPAGRVLKAPEPADPYLCVEFMLP